MTARAHRALSVVLGAPDGFDAVRRTVSFIRAQTARDAIELLLVVPPHVEIDLDAPAIASEIDGIGSVRVVRVLRESSGGAARAAGARAASTPIVAYAEDHCFPDPEWGAAFIDAHATECAAVGPAIRNANPDGIVSWADLFIAYGPWLAPGRRRAMTCLPGHNSSYKRDVLLAYGDALDDLMESETVLFWDLRRRGYVLRQEPRATAAHMNFGLWKSWLLATAVHGQLFAGTRSEAWSGVRRAAWVLASPIIPVVRLVRVVRDVSSSGVAHGLLVRAVPAMIVGLIADAIGQCVGYAVGAGASGCRASVLEAHRERHVRHGGVVCPTGEVADDARALPDTAADVVPT